MNSLRPFHLAIPVYDLSSTRTFYLDVLGAKEGRSASTWVDFNLFGHQVVAHVVADNNDTNRGNSITYNQVDGDKVPVPHFGVILTVDEWNDLVNRIRENDWEFEIEPKFRFEGASGEQSIMFLKDPSGNALEFKSFKNLDMLFAK